MHPSLLLSQPRKNIPTYLGLNEHTIDTLADCIGFTKSYIPPTPSSENQLLKQRRKKTGPQCCVYFKRELTSSGFHWIYTYIYLMISEMAQQQSSNIPELSVLVGINTSSYCSLGFVHQNEDLRFFLDQE